MYKQRIVSLALAAFLFSGCALEQIGAQMNQGSTKDSVAETKQSVSSVQAGEMKSAIAILIAKVETLENQMAKFMSLAGSMTQQISDEKQETVQMKQKNANLENKLAFLEQNISTKFAEIDKNITDITAAPKVFKSSDSNSSVSSVTVKIKRVTLMDIPSGNGKKVKYAYRGDAFKVDGKTNGYYFIPSEMAYVNSKWVKEADKTKSVSNETNKTKKKKTNEPVKIKQADKQDNVKNDAFFSEQNTNEKPVSKSPKVANEKELKNCETAKGVGIRLKDNPNVTQNNIDQQCAVELLKIGIKSDKSTIYIDSCKDGYKAKK